MRRWPSMLCAICYCVPYVPWPFVFIPSSLGSYIALQPIRILICERTLFHPDAVNNILPRSTRRTAAQTGSSFIPLPLGIVVICKSKVSTALRMDWIKLMSNWNTILTWRWQPYYLLVNLLRNILVMKRRAYRGSNVFNRKCVVINIMATTSI